MIGLVTLYSSSTSPAFVVWCLHIASLDMFAAFEVFLLEALDFEPGGVVAACRMLFIDLGVVLQLQPFKTDLGKHHLHQQ